MDILKKIIEEVPEYDSFMTVDELNESSFELKRKYPDTVDLFEIGRSTDGEPIYCLKLGNGKLKALLYAFPHPNEPVGSLMVDYISWKLAESRELMKLFDYTWFIIKVADVDGARLNEGWFKKPYSFLEYILNYYRPAGNQQVEWTFPIDYKTLKFDSPIPETKALMNIIEQEKPIFIYSLHNAGFGGVYYYITEEAHLLYPIYEKSADDRNVPLALGEPEVPYVKKVADAVYMMPTTVETYDYLEKYADKDPAKIIKSGDSSFGYARKFNPCLFELVCEVPYYYDERIEDERETEFIRRDLVLEFLEFQKEDMEELERMMEKIKDRINVRTKFQQALEYFVETFKEGFPAQKKWAETSDELNRKAIVAEEFDNRYVARSYSLFKWGLFLRMLKANNEGGKFEDEIENVENKIKKRVQELEEKVEFNVIPIKKLVQIQLMAGLYSMLYVQGRNS